MIYYPLSVLMNAGIREILIISTPDDTPRFEALLGDGHQFGIELSYAVQPSPDGLAQAFVIGADFIGNDNVAMVLGDNIFCRSWSDKEIEGSCKPQSRCYCIRLLCRRSGAFGIVEFDKNGKGNLYRRKAGTSKEQLLCNWSLFLRITVLLSMQRT